MKIYRFHLAIWLNLIWGYEKNVEICLVLTKILLSIYITHHIILLVHYVAASRQATLEVTDYYREWTEATNFLVVSSTAGLVYYFSKTGFLSVAALLVFCQMMIIIFQSMSDTEKQ